MCRTSSSCLHQGQVQNSLKRKSNSLSSPSQGELRLNEKEVAIVRVVGDVRSAVERGLELIGGFEVGDGHKVVMKPNLCHKSSPEAGATTDVRVVDALVDYFLGQGRCTVKIVESDSYARSADQVFGNLAYRELEKKPAVQLVNLSKEEKRREVFDGQFFKEIEIPEILVDCDVFVTVAKLKTSLVDRMSGAYKNQFGCLSSKEKRLYHPFLNEVLFDLNALLNPSLCVVDGIVAMEGCGPTDGLPRPVNIIVVGRDAVTVDTVLCHIMGIDPFDVPHLRYAYENGQGEIRIDEIQLLGEPIESVKTDFILVPPSAYGWISRGMKMGRYPPPIRNLGILLFTWGNYKAGKEFSTRGERYRKEGSRPSAWSFLKKALWTRRWNV